MLDILVILIILITIIFMFYSISERNVAFCVLTAILWLILAALMLQGVEVPYEMFNSTSGNIETGVHVIRDNLIPISYLFMGLGALMFMLTFTFAFEFFTDYKKMKP